jgi:hypothetical protein
VHFVPNDGALEITPRPKRLGANGQGGNHQRQRLTVRCDGTSTALTVAIRRRKEENAGRFFMQHRPCVRQRAYALAQCSARLFASDIAALEGIWCAKPAC